jgi:membrane protease YdiL (CAAX protease family)
MRERIRNWSGRTELVLVLLIAFGATVPRSLTALLLPDLLVHRTSPPITNAALHSTLLYELAVMAILAMFLRVRGWTLERLGIRPTVRDSILGLGIFIGYYLAYVVLVMAVLAVWPRFAQIAMSTHLVGGRLEWPTMLAVSLVNPVFEEVFVCGYVISALKERRGITTAINVSAGIRVFCHLYQGAVGVLGIVPMALIFAYWFARTGRLWPLIVAHALDDLFGLAMQSG